VHAQPAGASIGARIAARRQLLGISVRQAADRAGLNASTWSRIERGLLGADNRVTLAKIAEALKCSSVDLAGLPGTPTDAVGAETHGAAYETIRAVIESDLRYEPTVTAPPVTELQREVALIDDLRGRCDYLGAAQRLPAAIRGLHAASYGPDRTDALRSLVIATDNASFVVRYTGQPAAACLVAERAQQAADLLEDPVMLGLAAWTRSHAATGCGLYQRGLTIADRAATELRPHIERPDAGEMYGALLLQAAFASYAIGNPADADERLAEAERVAGRTGDSTALSLMFGPTNIRFWKVSIETDTGDPGEAVELAQDTNPVAVPRLSRQASFYLDTGRALAHLGRDKEAVRMLLAAERIAPQRIRNSPLATETARTLLERARRNAAGTELRGLCERLGIAA
jgi:transcriptional regulator with XRE-family HTH domain